MVDWSVEDRGPGRAAYLRQQDEIDKANREYDREHGTNRYAEHQAAEHAKFKAWQKEERARRAAERRRRGG